LKLTDEKGWLGKSDSMVQIQEEEKPEGVERSLMDLGGTRET